MSPPSKARMSEQVHLLPPVRFRPFLALLESFRAGYKAADLRSDLMAGVVVGVVALPLSMALAIATGVPPQYGLYTAIVAGFITSLMGGSRTQVSGPTAAFVVILVPIVAKFGLGGLLMATMMAGLILLAMGLFGMGKLIEFIPHPVTTGFTAGIGVVIATFQLKDFLGLKVAAMPEHFVEKLGVLWTAAPTFHWPDFTVGAFTLLVLIAFPRVTRRIPAPLVALSLAVGFVFLMRFLVAGFDVATIGSRFSYTWKGALHAGIPQLPPVPILPWTMPGSDGATFALDWDHVRLIFPSALAIAALGAIESLLSAVVADGMAGTKHDPDAELVAQGAANLVAPFFGGFASTGAIARTATNIRAGARSPIAAAVHSLFVLAAVLALAPLLGYLPMAALAALLLVVAWNMAEAKHFLRTVRVAPRSDVAVLLICFGLTVFFDMVVSVGVGIILAALLFMRRMAAMTGARMIGEHHHERRGDLPHGVVLYEIAGPLFFGAAAKAMSELHTVDSSVRAVIVDLEGVPIMDATGIVAFESAIDRLLIDRRFVILAGVQDQPRELLTKCGIEPEAGKLALAATVEEGIRLAREHVDQLTAVSKVRKIADPGAQGSL